MIHATAAAAARTIATFATLVLAMVVEFQQKCQNHSMIKIHLNWSIDQCKMIRRSLNPVSLNLNITILRLALAFQSSNCQSKVSKFENWTQLVQHYGVGEQLSMMPL